MKGLEYYDDRAYYPSSSNLSAFAPPFSVNRTNSKDVSAPYVDLAESTDSIPSNDFPVHSRPYGYDFFSNPVRELDSTPSSKAYGYSGMQAVDPPTSQLPHFNTLGTFTYDQCSNGTKSSLVEAEPYHPSYISPSIHDANPSATLDRWSSVEESKKSPEIRYSGQTAGFWNQFAEFNQGDSKQVEVGGRFCSKESNVSGPIVEENLLNGGCRDVKGSDNEVLHGTNLMGWEKHGVPISADRSDDKSCWWQTANSIPFDFSSTSVQGCSSVSQETHYEAPLKLVADSGNHHPSYTASSDKYLRQRDKPSLVDSGSSASIMGIAMDSNVRNIAPGGDLGSNNTTNMKEAYPLPSSESAGCFDLGQLRMHLERDKPASSNNVMLSDNNVSTGVVDYVLKARHGFQNSQANLNNLSLGFSSYEGVNSIERSFDSVDRCNPAVDSPCWKGAPAAHFFAFGGSKALHPEYSISNEEYISPNFQGPQNFLHHENNNVKVSSQMHDEIDSLEKGLAGLSGKFSVTNFASEKNNLDGALNVGCLESKPIYDCGLQYLDDIFEMKENSVPSHKSTYDSESRFSNTEQEVIEENKCMSKKQPTLCGECVDAKVKANEFLNYGASHAAEPSLSLPFVAAAPTALKESAVKRSTPTINIQTLVDTMHNLSELLLFHCMNEACELKEKDLSVLSNVISNLNSCALKNAEQASPAQECNFTQPNPSKSARDSHELQQNARVERPHLTKPDPECSKVEHENLPVQDLKFNRFLFGNRGKFSYSFLTKGYADMMKEENMNKALKRILSENFHDDEGADSQTLLYKNLWLEAEAAICSINYRARYNQMKIEMEKCCKRKDNDLEVEEQSKLDVPSLSAAQSSATKVNIFPTPSYSAENLPVLNAANLKESSGLKFSPDLNKPCASTPEDNGSQNLDSFVQDSSVFGTNKESGDCEASTKTIFYAHNFGAGKLYVHTANPKELPSSGASHAVDTADILASGQTDSKDHVNFTNVSPIPGKNKADDYVSSAMTGFHILKSRDEESCINIANPEKLPSSEAAHAIGTLDKLASGRTDSKIQDNFAQVLPIPDKTKADDYVSSVMARFHVLKSRAEDVSSMSSEGQLLDGVGFAGNITDCTITRNAAEGHGLDFSVNPAIMHLCSYTAVEQSNPEVYHPNLEDDEEIQPRETYRFGIQLPTYYSDGFSSEWEHVKMEELVGQTSKP